MYQLHAGEETAWQNELGVIKKGFGMGVEIRGKKAHYIYFNGDKELVTIIAHDGHGRSWVKWKKDGIINMVKTDKLEEITKDLNEASCL